MVKVYIDACCYSRPFDNAAHLAQPTVEQEIAAIRDAVRLCRKAGIPVVGSPTVIDEIGRIRDSEKFELVRAFYDSAVNEYVELSADITKRAAELAVHGIKERDAFHTAFAEAAGAAFLLTTDDRFERKAKTLVLNTAVINPINFLPEVIQWIRLLLTQETR